MLGFLLTQGLTRLLGPVPILITIRPQYVTELGWVGPFLNTIFINLKLEFKKKKEKEGHVW